MFQLAEEEVELMVSENAISSKQHLGGSLPFVFTEQGVAAISTVLTSERAIEVNIQIMQAFVAMRKFITTNAQIGTSLKDLGKKWFAFSKMDKEAFKMLERLNKIAIQDIGK